MNKITVPKWPLTLLDSDWKKKSKTVKKTGIGETLRTAQKLYDQIRWDYIKNFESVPGMSRVIEGETNKRIGVFWAGFSIKNLAPLQEALNIVARTATAWKNSADKMDKTIAAAVNAANVIAIHANEFSKELDTIDTKIRQNLIEFESQAVAAPSGKVITETYTLKIEPSAKIKAVKGLKVGTSSVTVKYSHADFGGKENPVFAQLVVDRIQKIAERVPDRVEKYIKDTAAKGSMDKNAIKAINKFIAEQVAHAAEKIQAVPEIIWNEYIAGKKEYKAYKRKIATTVAKEVGSIGLSAGGLASGATTGGLSTVLAAIKLVNSFITLGKLLRKVLIGADTAGKDAIKQLEKLSKEYQEKEKSLWRDYAKDVGNTLIESFVNLPIFTTIATADDKLTLWSQKTSGALIAGVKGGKSLQGALDGLDVVERELKKLTGTKADKNVKKALTALNKLQSNMMSSIEAIEKTMKIYENHRSSVKKAKKVMEVLKRSRRETVPLGADIFKTAIPILTGLPFLIIDPAENALNWVETGYDLTTQLIEYTQDAYEEAAIA